MLNLEGIVLVKFGATWCAPCKILTGVLNKIKSEFNEINFQDVDIDDYPALAKEYKIRSVPTIVILRNGIEINRILGAAKIEAIRKVLNDIVKDKAA